MPNTHTTLSDLFDDIADAIREKDGTSAAIVADTFPDRIAAIDTDPSGDATATAADILYPKTAYVNGQKITGSIVSVTPAFDGGDVTGSVTGITGSNVTLSDTNNGISITGAASATRGAVLYNGAVAGVVNKADNDTALAAGSATALTGKTRYITAVGVPADVQFTVTTANDTAYDTTSFLTINNGNYRRVRVNNNGYVYVSTPNSNEVDTTVEINNSYNSVAVTNKDSYTVTVDSFDQGENDSSHYVSSGGFATWSTQKSSYSSSIDSNLSVIAYSSSGTLEVAKQVVSSGNWVQNTVTPSTSAQGPYYGRTTVNAMSDGTAAQFEVSGASVKTKSNGAGYVAANTTVGTVASMTLPTATITSGQSGTNKLTIDRATGTRYLQIPVGYNATAAYYTISGVANMTLPTAASSTSSGTAKATIAPSTSAQYLNIPTGYNTAASYYTISAMPTSTITNNTTLPSGSTSSGTINRGSYIKIGAGYVSADTYYLAQADAHSSYTPSSTYFQTSTTGAVSAAKIEANKYATSAYYVKSATPAFDGGAVSGSVSVASSTMTLADDDPNGVRLSITGSGSATRAAVLYNGAVAGWVDKADNATALAAGSATALTGATKYITNINVPTGKVLHLTAAAGSGSSSSSIFIDSLGEYREAEITNNGGTVFVTNNDGTNNYGLVNVTDKSTNSSGGAVYAAYSNTQGYLTASAYNGSTLESFKEIVVAGKWKQNTVTPSGSAQGPFYGRTTVNAATIASVSVSGTAMTITGGIVTLA